MRIRQKLRNKCKEAWRQNWEENIENIISLSRDSKAFWSKINLSKGKNLIHTNYLKDTEGNRYYTDKEKYDLMESTWKDVFRITEDDEVNFDAAHSKHINSYIDILRERVKPHNDSNLKLIDSIMTTFTLGK